MNMTADKQLSETTLDKGRGVNLHDRFYQYRILQC